MVLSTYDVGDSHLYVIANDREIVKRMTVRAEQNEVLGVVVASFLNAVNGVVKCRSAVHRHFKPYREWLAGGRTSVRFSGRKITKRIVPHILFALSRTGPVLDRILNVRVRRRLSHGKITIRFTLRQQPLGSFAMFVGVVGLKNDLFVVVEFEPCEPVEYRTGRFFGRTGKVGILDPKQKLAADMACVEIVEKCGPGGPDM